MLGLETSVELPILEAFKSVNGGRQPYLKIDNNGNILTTQNRNEASSVAKVDEFVRTACVPLLLPSQAQLPLLKELKVYYQRCLQFFSPAKVAQNILRGDVDENLAMLKEKAAISRELAQTLNLINQKENQVLAYQRNYQKQREEALQISLELAKEHVEAGCLLKLYSDSLPKEMFNLAARHAGHQLDAIELDKKYRGIHILNEARRRTSFALRALTHILFENRSLRGIKTQKEIDDLCRLCQARLNFYRYSKLISQLQHDVVPPHKQIDVNRVVQEVQNNIDLLDFPLSKKVTHLPDGSTCFVIPGGWREHYISFKMRKRGNRYFLDIDNKGAKVDDQRLHGSVKIDDPKTGKTFRKTTVTIETTKEALQDPSFLKKIIGFTAQHHVGDDLYNTIYDHFIQSRKGTIVRSQVEERLEALCQLIAATGDPNIRTRLLEQAFSLMKQDKHFRPCQLYGTCTESNYLTTEDDIAPLSVRRAVEAVTLIHQVNRLHIQMLKKQYPAGEVADANLVGLRSYYRSLLLRIRLIHDVDFAAEKMQALNPPAILSENELAPFVEGIKNGSLQYRYLPKYLKYWKPIIEAAVDKDINNIAYVPSPVRVQISFIQAMIRKNIEACRFVFPQFNQPLNTILDGPSRNALIAHIQADGSFFSLLPPIFRNDEQIALAAIKRNESMLEYVPKGLLTRTDFLKAAMDQNIGANLFIPMEFAGPLSDILSDTKKDELIELMKMEAPDYYRAMHSVFRKDPEIALAGVERDGTTLEILPEELRKNPTVVKAANQQNSTALKFALPPLTASDVMTPAERNDWIHRIAQNRVAAADIPPFLQEDEALFLEIVQLNGLALEFASDKLKATPKVVRASIDQNILALKYASPELQIDELFPLQELDAFIQTITHQFLAGKKDLLPYLKHHVTLLTFICQRTPEIFLIFTQDFMMELHPDSLGILYAEIPLDIMRKLPEHLQKQIEIIRKSTISKS